MTGTAEKGFRVRALGEIAIRCADIGRMSRFYAEVIGLERLHGAHGDGIVFFDLGAGVQGHRTVLALFQSDADRPPATGEGGSLHHLALSLPSEEQQAVIDWYDRLGQPYRVETFGWIGWRGIFTRDPEGNTVEIVAYHAALRDAADGA